MSESNALSRWVPAAPLNDDTVPVLRGMAATLARDAVLWLAAPWPRGGGHTPRPVRDADDDALEGVSDEPDRALGA